MRHITVTGLTLEFDANRFTKGSAKAQAKQAIALVNSVLGGEPYVWSFQLSSEMRELDVEEEFVNAR
jgi:hypothetical protein